MAWMEEELKIEAKAIAKRKKEEFPEEFKAQVREKRMKLIKKNKFNIILTGGILAIAISMFPCVGNVDALLRSYDDAVVEDTVVDLSNTYQDSNGNIWINEEAYIQFKKYEEQEKLEISTNDYYLAPDGSAWVSMQDYFKYKNTLINPENQVIDNPISDYDTQYPSPATQIDKDNTYFQAPDGSVWVNKEEYNNYMQSNNPNDIQNYSQPNIR